MITGHNTEQLRGEKMLEQSPREPLRCICSAAQFFRVFTYHEPPEGETQFSFSSSESYLREVVCCELCGHFLSQHAMEDERLYTGDYVTSTYGDAGGLRRSYDRIMALPENRSDNAARVRRVMQFAGERFAGWMQANRQPSVLDVGSGLCVFLSRMKSAGWNCTALDPDARAVEHAREKVGVRAFCCDFMAAQELGTYDVVSFNKVLEHVKDPVAMLARARLYLNPHGFVYLEVPDGEAAAADGPGREEFFVDHHHIFSIASATIMAVRAGFSVLLIERLQEPSRKFTIRAFLSISTAKRKDPPAQTESCAMAR